MRGDADDLVGPQLGPCGFHVHIVLADVHAVGVAGERELDVVVDDQRRAVSRADFFQRYSFGEECRAVQILLAKLDHRRAALKSFFDSLRERLFAQIAPVGDGVQPQRVP